jgi:hypothetical protein
MSPILVAVTAMSLSITAVSPAWASGWVVQSSPDGSPRHNTLRSVAALSVHDAWAVGNTVEFQNEHANVLIEHWDGTSWALVPGVSPGLQSNELHAVGGTSPTDVWAVGEYNDVGGHCPQPSLIEHWNGRKWKVVPSPNPRDCTNLNGVAAISPTDAWAVGEAFDEFGQRTSLPLVEHWDGTSWRMQIKGLPKEHVLYGVSAVAPDDVWVVGDTLVADWDGTAWTVVHSMPHPPAPYSIAAVAFDDVWVAGTIVTEHFRLKTYTQHWDGSSWNVVPSPNRGRRPYDILHGIAAAGPADVWAVGEWASSDGLFHTLILHWNGVQWSLQSSPDGSTDNALYGAAALPATNTAWAVGQMSSEFDRSSTLVESHPG